MSLFDTHTPVSGGQQDYPDAPMVKWETPGQVVEGEVVDMSDELPSTKGNGNYRILTVETADGVVKFFAGSVLLDKINRAGTRKGGQLAVRFNGMKDNKKKTFQYKDYDVIFVPAEGDNSVASGGVTSSRPTNARPY